jgi:hypothetical protein
VWSADICGVFNIRLYLSDAVNIRKNTFGKFVCKLILYVVLRWAKDRPALAPLALTKYSVSYSHVARSLLEGEMYKSVRDFQRRSLNRVLVGRREGGMLLTARFDTSQTGRL